MKIIKEIFSPGSIDKTYEGLFAVIKKVSIPDGCIDMATFIVSELFANVKEHSFAKKGILECSISGSTFFFSLEDNGIGIKNSFIKNGIFAKDDRTALQLATGGLSTKKLNERAFGLYSVQRLAERMGGILVISTGKVKAEFKKKNVLFMEPKKELKGVKVAVKIPLKKINLYEMLY